MEYQTNQVFVFTTDIGTELDQKFKRFVEGYHETYSDQTLLDGLVGALSFATVLSMVWISSKTYLSQAYSEAIKPIDEPFLSIE